MGRCQIISEQSGGDAAGAGMWTTVQVPPPARPGRSMLGIPAGGAADAISVRIGNALVGNRAGGRETAGLEMTLTGACLEFEESATVALAGAFGASQIVSRGGGASPARCWAPLSLQAGDRLLCGPIGPGARGYMCVRGGVQVPEVLGSRATYLAGGVGFGGLEGRTLRVGDRIEFGGAQEGSDAAVAREALSAAQIRWIESWTMRRVLRAVDGSHADLFDGAAAAEFWSAEFVVQSRSDRVGVRLAPERASISPPAGGRLASEGMPHGAVQIPARGEAIVLGPDHPTTGGYPVIAAVIRADLPALGQVRPGERVRFERVSRDRARALWREQEEAIGGILD